MSIEDVLERVGQILTDERYPPALKLWMVREHVKGYDEQKIQRLMKGENE